MRAVRFALWLSPFGILCLLGCAQKLTYDRWQTIRDGDPPEAVQTILGEPVEKLDMRWLYMDADRGIAADIYFKDQKVVGKTWQDVEHGMVGKSPNVNKPGDSESFRYRKTE